MKMNFAEQRADDIKRRYIANGLGEIERLKSKIKENLYEFIDDSDRILYLNIIAESNQQGYEKHLKVCTDINVCHINKDHEHLAYFINKQLYELGIQINEDMFTAEEKQSAEDKLDKLMNELEEIKLSQTVTFEYLFNEMEELKKHFYLGKKKWKELFIGKGIEMTLSGIISETVSKKVLSAFNDKIIPWLTNG